MKFQTILNIVLLIALSYLGFEHYNLKNSIAQEITFEDSFGSKTTINSRGIEITVPSYNYRNKISYDGIAISRNKEKQLLPSHEIRLDINTGLNFKSLDEGSNQKITFDYQNKMKNSFFSIRNTTEIGGVLSYQLYSNKENERNISSSIFLMDSIVHSKH